MSRQEFIDRNIHLVGCPTLLNCVPILIFGHPAKVNIAHWVGVIELRHSLLRRSRM